MEANNMFKGTATALITPFHKDGSIDEEGLRELVDFQEASGIDAIVPCGSTGESATLDHGEHLKVIDIVIDQAKKAKIIAGTGSNSTQEAIDLSVKATDMGADYILSVSPYYNKPTQEGIYLHFKRISEACDIPIILYNVPGRTGSNMSSETTLRLAELPGICGIKEASGNLNQIMDILSGRPPDFSVISGDDAITFTMMSLGGNGVISVCSNCAPKMMMEMVNSALNGDWDRASKMHYRLLPLFRAMFLESNPIPIKAALRLMGKPSGSLRMPLTEMTPENESILADVMRSIGLI